MKYFLDTEFIERGAGHPIDLISIGIVAENGREFYAQNLECKFSTGSEWVYRNVYPFLYHFSLKDLQESCPSSVPLLHGCAWMTRAQMRKEILNFTDPSKYGAPEFWGYFADYDWVLFVQLFGRLVDLPEGYPQYCLDLKQWMHTLGVERKDLPEVDADGPSHHALSDARWNRRVWGFLSLRERTKP